MSAQEKAQRYNSSVAQELYLEQGGTLAGWYACAGAPATDPLERRIKALASALPNDMQREERFALLSALVFEAGVEP